MRAEKTNRAEGKGPIQDQVAKVLRDVLDSVCQNLLLDPKDLDPTNPEKGAKAYEEYKDLENAAADLIGRLGPNQKVSQKAIGQATVRMAAAVLLDGQGTSSMKRGFSALVKNALGEPPAEGDGSIKNRSHIGADGRINAPAAHMIWKLAEKIGVSDHIEKSPIFGRNVRSFLEKPGTHDLTSKAGWQGFGLQMAGAVLKDGADLAIKMLGKLLSGESKSAKKADAATNTANDRPDVIYAGPPPPETAMDPEPSTTERQPNAETNATAHRFNNINTGDRRTVVKGVVDDIVKAGFKKGLLDNTRKRGEYAKTIQDVMKKAKSAAVAQGKAPPTPAASDLCTALCDVLANIKSDHPAAEQIRDHYKKFRAELPEGESSDHASLVNMFGRMLLDLGIAIGGESPTTEDLPLDPFALGMRLLENLNPQAEEAVKKATTEANEASGGAGMLVQGDTAATAKSVLDGINAIRAELGSDPIDAAGEQKVAQAFGEVFGEAGPQDSLGAAGAMLAWLGKQGVKLPAVELATHNAANRIRDLAKSVVELEGVWTEAKNSADATQARIKELEADLPTLEGEAKTEVEGLLAEQRAEFQACSDRVAKYVDMITGTQEDLGRVQQSVAEAVQSAARDVALTAIDPEKMRAALASTHKDVLDKVTDAGRKMGLIGGDKADAKHTDGPHVPDGKGDDPRYDNLLEKRRTECAAILADTSLNVVDKILWFIMTFVKYADRQQEMLLEDFAKTKEAEAEWLEKKQDCANKAKTCKAQCDGFKSEKDEVKKEMARLRMAQVNGTAPEDADQKMQELDARFQELEAQHTEATQVHLGALREERESLSEQPTFDTDMLELRIRRTRDLRDQMLKLGNDLAEEEKRVLERINRV